MDRLCSFYVLFSPPVFLHLFLCPLSLFATIVIRSCCGWRCVLGRVEESRRGGGALAVNNLKVPHCNDGARGEVDCAVVIAVYFLPFCFFQVRVGILRDYLTVFGKAVEMGEDGRNYL